MTEEVKQETIATAPAEAPTQQAITDLITIDGKEYSLNALPLVIRNGLVARQEIQQSKIRHEMELEKIEVLTNHYNDKIKKGLEEFNGSDSKPKD
jgi:hypothetical protein|tara:strand:- start:1400 stop:1684 length:285 start_codon:yes stop_codon:yes gene_type:complete